MAEVHALTREAPAGPRRMKSDESSTAACASVGWVVAFRLAIVFSLVVGSDHQPSWRAVATFAGSGGHATYRTFRTRPPDVQRPWRLGQAATEPRPGRALGEKPRLHSRPLVPLPASSTLLLSEELRNAQR